MDTPTQPTENYVEEPLFMRAYVKFIEFGIPRLFSWIEWAGFIALLRFVGKKYDITSVLVVGGVLVPLLGLHMAFIAGSAAADLTIRRKGSLIWSQVAPVLLTCIAATFAMWFFIDKLIDGLIRAQG